MATRSDLINYLNRLPIGHELPPVGPYSWRCKQQLGYGETTWERTDDPHYTKGSTALADTMLELKWQPPDGYSTIAKLPRMTAAQTVAAGGKPVELGSPKPKGKRIGRPPGVKFAPLSATAQAAALLHKGYDQAAQKIKACEQQITALEEQHFEQRKRQAECAAALKALGQPLEIPAATGETPA
jgi:hypothetical protein